MFTMTHLFQPFASARLYQNRRFSENGSFWFFAATSTYTCLCGPCEPVGLTDLLWDLSVPTSPAGGGRPTSRPVSVLNFSFLLRRRLYLTHERFHPENHRGRSHHPVHVPQPGLLTMKSEGQAEGAAGGRAPQGERVCWPGAGVEAAVQRPQPRSHTLDPCPPAKCTALLPVPSAVLITHTGAAATSELGQPPEHPAD